MKRLSLITTLLLSLFVFSACENDEEANLYKAQECLNTATEASANGCLIPIAGLSSKRSHVIRCSIAFVSQGIDDDAIVAAFENIKGEKGGDPTTPTLAALTMKTTDAASDAVATCTQTGSDALIALANMANLSTAVADVFSLTPPFTGADLDTQIDGFTPGTTAEKEALASAILTAQPALCNADNGLFKDTSACKDINQAVTANPGGGFALADALLANLDNQDN